MSVKQGLHPRQHQRRASSHTHEGVYNAFDAVRPTAIVTWQEPVVMCRNIKTLFNFAPPATEEEIRAASLQFVRKLSGFNAPSRANEASFELAVEEVFQAARRLLSSLETNAQPRDRDMEAAKAKARAAERSGHRIPA